MRNHRFFLAFLTWACALGVLASLVWLGFETWQALKVAGQALTARGWARAIGVAAEPGVFLARCLIDTACGEVLLGVWGRAIVQWHLYVPFVPLTGWVVLGVAERFSGKFQDPGQGRWATPADLATYLRDRSRQPRRIGYLGLVGKQVLRLPENARCAHTLIIGGTGAGKTTRYLNPNLLLDARDGLSAVVFDLKYPDPRSGMLGTINYFRAWGRTVYAFTPFDPGSARLPLLEGINSVQTAFELAETFRPSGVEDGAVFYRNNERQLLAGLLLGVAQDPAPSMRKVYELLSQGAEPLKTYIAARPQVAQLLTALLALKADVLAGICTGLAGDLQLFLHPALDRATSAGPGRRLDLRSICLEPGYLYIGMPQEELQGGRGQVLLRLFKRLLDKAILDVAAEHGGRLPVHLSVYLDEFPSFGPLPNIAENLATMRSRRVAYHIALQNRAQGEAVYGRDEFRAMVNNNFAQMVIFPRSLRLEDAQFFSESFGEITVREESHSINQEPGLFGVMSRSRQSRSFKEVARPLLSAEAMRTFPDGYAVIELIGTPPATVRMPRMDEKDSPLRAVSRSVQSRFEMPNLRVTGAAAPFMKTLPEALTVPVAAQAVAVPPPNPLAGEFRGWVAGLLSGGVPLELETEGGKPLSLTLRRADLDELPTDWPAWTERGWVNDDGIGTEGECLTVTKLGLSRAERLWKALAAHHTHHAALSWASQHAAQLEGHPRRDAQQPPVGRWQAGAVWLPLDAAMELPGADSVEWQDVELGGRVASLVEVRWAPPAVVPEKAGGIAAD